MPKYRLSDKDLTQADKEDGLIGMIAGIGLVIIALGLIASKYGLL